MVDSDRSQPDRQELGRAEADQTQTPRRWPGWRRPRTTSRRCGTPHRRRRQHHQQAESEHQREDRRAPGAATSSAGRASPTVSFRPAAQSAADPAGFTRRFGRSSRCDRTGRPARTRPARIPESGIPASVILQVSSGEGGDVTLTSRLRPLQRQAASAPAPPRRRRRPGRRTRSTCPATRPPAPAARRHPGRPFARPRDHCAHHVIVLAGHEQSRDIRRVSGKCGGDDRGVDAEQHHPRQPISDPAHQVVDRRRP